MVHSSQLFEMLPGQVPACQQAGAHGMDEQLAEATQQPDAQHMSCAMASQKLPQVQVAGNMPRAFVAGSARMACMHERVSKSCTGMAIPYSWLQAARASTAPPVHVPCAASGGNADFVSPMLPQALWPSYL